MWCVYFEVNLIWVSALNTISLNLPPIPTQTKVGKCLEKDTQAQGSTHASKSIVFKTAERPFAEVALQSYAFTSGVRFGAPSGYSMWNTSLFWATNGVTISHSPYFRQFSLTFHSINFKTLATIPPAFFKPIDNHRECARRPCMLDNP